MQRIMETNTVNDGVDISKFVSFIDKLISKLEDDKTAFIIGSASEEKIAMYEKISRNDPKAMAELSYKHSSFSIIRNMFSDYMSELTKTKESLPKKFAVSADTNTVNIFAVIKDGDRQSSKNMYLSESVVIPHYYPKGFKISTMIFEESDKVEIPEGYEEYQLTN